MRDNGRLLTALIVGGVLLLVVGRPLGREAWLRMSGAVDASHTSSLTTDGRLRFTSIGGAPWGQSGGGTGSPAVYHAVVQLPPGSVTELSELLDRSGWSSASHVLAERWRVTRERRSVEVGFRAEYDPVWQRVRIDGESYRLSKGNVFVVRIDDRGARRVTQLPSHIASTDGFDAVMDAAAAGIPDDAALQADLRGLTRQYQLPRSSAAYRPRPPASGT